MEEFDVLDENGEYKNVTASREECHKKGLWHRAVVIFIIEKDNQKILLQQRSKTKKMWPNLWDITAGGHVLKGELGVDAVVREAKEELGISLKKSSLEFIGATRSETKKNDMIDKHFNEYFVTHEKIDISSISLQQEEVQAVKWFEKEDLIKKIKEKNKELTDKKGCWDYLLKYLERKEN